MCYWQHVAVVTNIIKCVNSSHSTVVIVMPFPVLGLLSPYNTQAILKSN